MIFNAEKLFDNFIESVKEENEDFVLGARKDVDDEHILHIATNVTGPMKEFSKNGKISIGVLCNYHKEFKVNFLEVSIPDFMDTDDLSEAELMLLNHIITFNSFGTKLSINNENEATLTSHVFIKDENSFDFKLFKGVAELLMASVALTLVAYKGIKE